MKSQQVDTKPHFGEVLGAARAIRRQLMNHKIKGGITVLSGGQEPTAVACVFDFSGVSQSPAAERVIKLLEQQGCGCASSGEDDVRCYCED